MREHAAAPKSNAELLLVGSWNAAKKFPEWQGKKVVDLYDKLRFPKYTKEQQKVADKTHAFLKKHQKHIGMGLTGIEVGLVTLGIVKGFQHLKQGRMRMRPIHSIHAAEQTIPNMMPSVGERVISSKFSHALEGIVGRVVSFDKEPAAIMTPGLAQELGAGKFSPGLRQTIAKEYFSRLLAAVADPGFIAQVDKAPYSAAKKDVIRMKMIRIGADFLSEQMTTSPSYAHMSLADALKDTSFQDVNAYLRGLRDWYTAANCPGLDVLGITIGG